MRNQAPEKPVTPKRSNLRKLESQVKPPSATVLRRLSAVDRRLLEQTLSQTLECVFYRGFRLASAEHRYMPPLGHDWRPAPGAKRNDDSGMDLLSPPRHRVLTGDEERDLFLRFNYARYRMMRVVRREQGKRLGVEATRELLHWAHEALMTRNAIVRVNTSLVMAMARRTRTVGVELNDLISEGNLALMRCVDKFDVSRGFKFSTYACRAIMSSFARLAAKTARHRSQFPAPYDPSFERSDYLERQRVAVADDCVDGLRAILAGNRAELSKVEQRVISERFVLGRPLSPDERVRPPTLEQVGASLGVSKERVRQIQNRALQKLRVVLEDDLLAVPPE